MKPNIIKLRYLKDGKPAGRPYTYFSENPVTIGDVVQVNEHAKGLVVDIDIPEEEIADIKHLVKYIHGKLEERL
jgi:hypothetical protein